MNKNTRLICSKCKACAEHPEDRINGKCHHCGSCEITEETRINGKWVNANKVTYPEADYAYPV